MEGAAVALHAETTEQPDLHARPPGTRYSKGLRLGGDWARVQRQNTLLQGFAFS